MWNRSTCTRSGARGAAGDANAAPAAPSDASPVRTAAPTAAARREICMMTHLLGVLTTATTNSWRWLACAAMSRSTRTTRGPCLTAQRDLVIGKDGRSARARSQTRVVMFTRSIGPTSGRAAAGVIRGLLAVPDPGGDEPSPRPVEDRDPPFHHQVRCPVHHRRPRFQAGIQAAPRAIPAARASVSVRTTQQAIERNAAQAAEGATPWTTRPRHHMH